MSATVHVRTVTVRRSIGNGYRMRERERERNQLRCLKRDHTVLTVIWKWRTALGRVRQQRSQVSNLASQYEGVCICWCAYTAYGDLPDHLAELVRIIKEKYARRSPSGMVSNLTSLWQPATRKIVRTTESIGVQRGWQTKRVLPPSWLVWQLTLCRYKLTSKTYKQTVFCKVTRFSVIGYSLADFSLVTLSGAIFHHNAVDA